MFLKKALLGIISLLFCLNSTQTRAFLLTGVSNFTLGTIVSPFPTITSTDTTVCVSAELLDLSTNYKVTATSSGGGTTAFRLVNASNSSYTLTYSVFWASPTTFVSLSPNTPTQFANAYTVLNPCPTTANAQLGIQILSANQVLAKQGNYSDTLTILVAP